MPQIDEQFEIVRLLADQLDQLNEQRAAVILGLKQAAAQRQNILKAAFSGQLVAQDPDDEPAAVLLERIRFERATRITISPSRARKQKTTA